MKVALLIQSLGVGGAERAACILANAFVEAGHEFHFILIGNPSENRAFQLHPEIQIHFLDAGTRGVAGVDRYRRLLALPAKIAQILSSVSADVAISFMDQANILLCLTKTQPRIPKIVCEQIHPAYSSLVDESKNFFFRAFSKQVREYAYQKATKIVLLSQSSCSYFSKGLQDKIEIIPNPIQAPVLEERNEPLPSPYLLSLGRLVAQKDFATLLRAFALIANEFPKQQLVVGGEGPQRGELEELRQQLGLASRVHFPGIIHSPYRAIAGADFFVMSSRFEGFPLALGEAMASGKLVIASDCLTGPADMIDHGHSGFLFPVADIQELSRLMRKCLTDTQGRLKIETAARSKIDNYSPALIIQQWEKLLRSL